MTETLYERVQHTLKTLDLTAMPLHLNQLAQQAATENWSALQFLNALTQAELAARTEQDGYHHACGIFAGKCVRLASHSTKRWMSLTLLFSLR